MIRVFEAFAGIGCQRMALRNIGIDNEVVGISEIDKYAIKSYMAIHGETKNFGDISKIEPSDIPDFDLLTYSFPCQDISAAGKCLGAEEGSGTRSSLLWECCKIIEEKKPKFLLMENVKNLISKKHKPQFEKFLCYLEGQGYTNNWEVLNSKDFGLPQNRERVFVVSVLNGEKIELSASENIITKTLKDILEEEVDEKFYVSNKNAIELIDKIKNGKKGTFPTGHNKAANPLASREHRGSGWKEIVPTLCARDYKDPKVVSVTNKIKQIGNIVKAGNWSNPQECRVYDSEGISPTLAARGWVKVLEIKQPTIELRIRKLTPKEYWRLMGISDMDFEKANVVCSKTQLYKQAGNGIVVNVLEHIFSRMFKIDKK